MTFDEIREQVNLLGETKYESLLDAYYVDRKSKFGGKELSFIPSSLWEIPTKNKYLTAVIEDDAEIREVKRTGGALGIKGLKFSEFKPDVAERVIEYWSEEGGLIVDPFAGRATRAIVSALLNRHYLGYECVPEYKDFIELRLSRLPRELQKRVEIRLGNGCQLRGIADNVADLVFTCPPYWNLEKYRSSEGQLSDCPSYADFLRHINDALNNCYRVLRRNCFLCLEVADWFLDGVFYPFHRDMMTLTEKAGFTLHDVVIVKVYSLFVSISAGQNKRAKRMGKQHEYLIIARKA